MEDSALTEARPARADEAPALAALLARAFAEDAVLNWFLCARRRRPAAELFFRQVLADALPLGGVRVGGNMAACAIWLPPDAARPKETFWSGIKNTLWILRVASPWRFSRLEAIIRMSEEIHPEAPCHYLYLIGTIPEARGRGLAAGLIEHTLKQADDEGVGAFLETGDAAKVAYYNRFGFELIGQAQLPFGGPTLNLMWREPRSR